MSQMRLEGGFADPIAQKCNNNFDELYATKLIDEAAIVAAQADATATLVKVQDTNGTPLIGPTVPKALLIANANIGLTSISVTLGNAVARGKGFTTAKGLDIIADANFAAGSDIYVTLVGYIA